MNFIKENEKRKLSLKQPYNPQTGLNCCGDRKELYLSDAPIHRLYLPKEMFDLPLLKSLVKHKTIEKFHKAEKKELNHEQLFLFWKDFCELRYRYDYEFYAFCTQTILHKEKGTIIHFKLNVPQQIILEEFEKKRLAKEPFHFNILKSRQFGSSTFIENYFEWIQIIHKTYWNSVICAHLQDPAKRIRAMYERSIKNKPSIYGVTMSIKGFQGSQNIKEIPERGCTITVGTALEPDSVRSDAVKLAHLSEMAFYPETEANNAEKVESSITSAIPEIEYTAIIRETTANGEDYFYKQYLKAKAGETSFHNIFIPWYMMDEYSLSFDGKYSLHNGRKKSGGVIEFVATLTESEKILFTNNKECTLEHLNWYRAKSGSMASISIMKQEYPSDDIEAFQFSRIPVFRTEDIKRQEPDCCNPEMIGNIVSACPPALWNTDPSRRKQILKNLRFVEDMEAMRDFIEGDTAMKERAKRDKLLIWELPNEEKNIKNQYIVIFDPQKGLSESADLGVISVIDRYWRMHAGKDELVAQWRGRLDKDIEIWIAAQIAKFYNNALLVVESNTYDQDSGLVDDSDYIFGIISDYYDNLYRREVKDSVKGGISLKYGFITNRQTKTSIIENYRSVIRENGYIERSIDCLIEARQFEQTKNGKWEAKKGFHDDILMSRMIGLYVSSQMDKPSKIESKEEVKSNQSGSYASM